MWREAWKIWTYKTVEAVLLLLNCVADWLGEENVGHDFHRGRSLYVYNFKPQECFSRGSMVVLLY